MRLLWHVEEGLGAWLPPNGMLINPTNGVTHATAEIEVCDALSWVAQRCYLLTLHEPLSLTHLCELQLAGQSITLEACFSLPPNYLRDSSVSCVWYLIILGRIPHALCL